MKIVLSQQEIEDILNNHILEKLNIDSKGELKVKCDMYGEIVEEVYFEIKDIDY